MKSFVLMSSLFIQGINVDILVGKIGFASHTKPTAKVTQGSTSSMRDNI